MKKIIFNSIRNFTLKRLVRQRTKLRLEIPMHIDIENLKIFKIKIAFKMIHIKNTQDINTLKFAQIKVNYNVPRSHTDNKWN